MHDVELPGIDGGNLLGYLAALGTLRVLTLAEAEASVRMSWEDRGSWRPWIHHSRIAASDELLDALEPRVCGAATVNAAWDIGEDLTLSCVEFGEQMRKAAADAGPSARDCVDFLAAFGSDVYGSGPKKETMSDTEFRTMSGAGHQHFLGFMKELAAGTERDQLRRTLFSEWDYADERPALRWDPADYRPHALRAINPSGDPIRTMRGANRLAVEALPLFPAVPQRRKIRTVGFDYGPGETAAVWPIWTDRIDLWTAASLIASMDADGRVQRPGVAQIFRAERFTEGKYRNFTPAKALR